MTALLALSTTLAAFLGGPALDNQPADAWTYHHAEYETIPAWELDVWARIARCESGGDLRAVNPSGKFRGEYQFWQVSWEAVGGWGDPIDATHEEQTWRAHLLRLQQGWGAWPECSRKAGVR